MILRNLELKKKNTDRDSFDLDTDKGVFYRNEKNAILFISSDLRFFILPNNNVPFYQDAIEAIKTRSAENDL